MTIASKISKLAEAEQKVAEEVVAASKEVSSRSEWRSFAQELLRADRPGHSTNLIAAKGGWAMCKKRQPQSDVPLYCQLLRVPTLIIDIPAYQENEPKLEELYGLTRAMLMDLANDGRLLFNLYEYETDKEQGFARYSRTPGIEEIVDHPACRINAARRRYFKELVGYSVPVSERSSSTERFFAAVAELARTARLREITGEDNEVGALKVVAENYDYVCRLADDPEAKEWVSKLPDKIAPEDSYRIIKQLRTLKAVYATPFTAAFGGFAVQTSDTLNNIVELSACGFAVGADFRATLKSIDSIQGAGLQYLASRIKAPSNSSSSRAFLPRRDFESFRSFLKDSVLRENSVLRFIDAVCASIGDEQSTLQTLESWHEAVVDARTTLAAYKSLKHLTASGVGEILEGLWGFANVALLKLFGEPLLPFEASDRAHNWLLRKAIRESRFVVLDTIERTMIEINEWQKANNRC